MGFALRLFALLGLYPRWLLIYWQDGGIGCGSTHQIFGIGTTICGVRYLEGM